MNEVLDKPGCFGYAVTFSPESKACNACSFLVECEEASLPALTKMTERRIEISRLLAERKRFRADQGKSLSPIIEAQPKEDAPDMRRKAPLRSVRELTEEQKTALALLPVKVAGEVRKIYERGIPFREELLAGSNPLVNGTPAFLSATCSLFIAGGFTRRALQDHFEQKFGWTERTSASHVSIACGVLKAFGFKESDGRFEP